MTAKLVSSILFLIAVANLMAQTSKGNIAGTVTDSSGAVVPNVQVVIKSHASGLRRETITDGQGFYRFALLDPGEYAVSYAHEGFETATYDPVSVLITETTTVNAKLAVAGTPIRVTVTADPVLQADNATTGRVVEQRSITQLPLATRNYTQLLALSPGAFATVADNAAIGLNSQNIAVNGSRPTNNNLMLNGIDANQIGLNNAANLPVPASDTLAEFKVQTSLYDASIGRSGGAAIAAITKSGTESFHGGIYEFFRNDALNANNFFFNRTGTPRPELKRNQFGGTFGGPLELPGIYDGRQRGTYFFLSYQGSREVNGASLASSETSAALPVGLTDTNRTALGLARTFGLSAGSIAPQAIALLNAHLPNGKLLIPSPQTGNTVGPNFTASVPARFREDQFNTNLDQRFSAANKLAIKYFSIDYPTQQEFLSFFDPTDAANLPGFGGSLNQRNRVLSLVDTHVISPTMVNELRAGLNRVYANFHESEPISLASVGMTRFNESLLPGIPSIQVLGSFNIGPLPIFDVLTGINTFTYGDTLSWTKGRHSLRFGGELRRSQENFNVDFFQRGIVMFLNFPQFLTGTPFLSIDGSGILNRNFRNLDWSLFAQDDLRVSDRLTLNLGLRYEVDGPASDTKGRLATFDPAQYRPGSPPDGFVLAGNVAPQYRIPGVPLTSDALLKTSDYNNIAPRIGFAFSPFSPRSLVLRGGYGIFFSRISNEAAFFSFAGPPFAELGVQLGGTFADPLPNLPLPNQFPIAPVVPTVSGAGLTGAPISAYTMDPNAVTPYMQQYNLNVQYEAAHNLVLEAGYVGSRGVKLLRRVGIAQPYLASPSHPVNGITSNTLANVDLRSPYPGLSPNSFIQFQTSGSSSYNSLQLSATERLRKGLQFLLSYTWSKSIDDAGSGSILGDSRITSEGDQHNLRLNRAVSDFDRPQRFVGSLTYDIPGWRSNSLLRRLTSGWGTAFIATLQSGTPLDIIDSSAGGLYGGSNLSTGIVSRANFAPGANLATAQGHGDIETRLNQYFNASAFVPAGLYFGTIGRNILRGPGQKNLDASLIRHFPVHGLEHGDVEFRAEFFNLFNFVNFANPGTDLAAAQTFGVVTNTSASARIVQFALKCNF